MRHKKMRKKIDAQTRISVNREMAKPRMARSVKIAELNLDAARIHELPSVTLPGTVD